jgi:hypothetical protein
VPVSEIVLPVFEQLPLALKLTARPELAVALTVKGGSPYVLFANALNVMVWSARIGLWVGVGECIRVGPEVFVVVRVIKAVAVPVLVGVPVKAPPVL